MAGGLEVLDGDQKEGWMNSKWRPAMGWMYMLVCLMDFVVFPILWSLLQAMSNGRVETQWSPITLQGAGLFHMAMGAVLGVAAFGRTQEKLAGVNNGGNNISPSGTTVASVSPTTPTANSFSSSTTTAYGAATTSSVSGGGFGSTPKSTTTESVSFSSSGKPMPVQPAQPEI